MPVIPDLTVCICGHPKSSHYTEEETVYFSGLFNPDLAGAVKSYVWMGCDADLASDPQGEPCSSMEHGWG